jgi:hypothetical protein
MNQVIYEHLKKVASRRQTTTYGQIAPLANLDMSSEADRGEIGRILGEISEAEHKARRPMLSAVVVRSGDGTPGQGFFWLAKDLGIYDGGDEEAFFAEELKKVHDYWASHG